MNQITTTTPEVIDLRSTTEVIEKSFVSEKTTSIYVGILVRFMMWLFDKHTHHIEPFILEDLVDSHERDLNAHINPPHAKRRRKTCDGKLPRNHLKSACRQHLAKMKPSINGSAHNSPIIIQGDNALTYETIREFMMEKKNQQQSMKKQ